jgi:hypothetical protein
MEATPVAMDTSPWSSTQTSSADSQQEKWADFTGKAPISSNEEEEKWADFSSISDLNRYTMIIKLFSSYAPCELL